MKFAYPLEETSYAGTVQFKIGYPDGSHAARSVRVVEDQVEVFNGNPPDGDVTCTVSLDRDTFFKVYMNEVSPGQAIFAGQMSVSNFAYRSLKNFGLSFDTSSVAWEKFYEYREQTSQQEMPNPEDAFLNHLLDECAFTVADRLLDLKDERDSDMIVNCCLFSDLATRANPYTKFQSSSAFEQWKPLMDAKSEHPPIGASATEMLLFRMQQTLDASISRGEQKLATMKTQWQQSCGWLAGLADPDPFLA
jgi:putative sterol carrier protein